jgi:dihydropteroate synthase
VPGVDDVEPAVVNVRFLAATGADDLRERFRTLSNKDVALLAARADARIFTLDHACVTSALRALLVKAGAGLADTEDGILIALSRAALEAASLHATGFERTALDALAVAFERAAMPAPTLQLRERRLDLRDEARVMGIVNVTPNSFYERVDGAEAALARARAMAADGAALIDIGGQSYAHWNARVPAAEERARVVPAVRAIVGAGLDVALSIDTFTASVADGALAAGAHLINDCSGLSDPALPEVVARHGAGLVVMHLKGTLMVREPELYVYRDALAEIVDFLYERTERAVAEGVSREAIAIDPGLEFGKEPATDLEILERFGELRVLGYPILFASSRKSFIGRVFDRPAKELLVPSLATAAIGIAAGARIVRVHDVAETVQLARMMAAATPRGRAALSVAEQMPGTPREAGNSAVAPAV